MARRLGALRTQINAHLILSLTQESGSIARAALSLVDASTAAKAAIRFASIGWVGAVCM